MIADQTLSDAKSHGWGIGALAGLRGLNRNPQQRLQRHLRLRRTGEIGADCATR
jgi:hypothetical protein